MVINNPHTFYYEIKDSETGNVNVRGGIHGNVSTISGDVYDH